MDYYQTTKPFESPTYNWDGTDMRLGRMLGCEFLKIADSNVKANLKNHAKVRGSGCGYGATVGI